MKEETKSMLKKVAKVGGYLFGLAALFILGLGAGYCSAQKTAEQSKTSAKALYADDGEEENLLPYSTLAPETALYVSGGLNYVSYSTYYKTYVFDSSVLPAGSTFMVSFDGPYFHWSSDFMGGLSYSLKESVLNPPHVETTFDSSLVRWVEPLNGENASPFVFYVPLDTYVVDAGNPDLSREWFGISTFYNITDIRIVSAATVPSISDIRFSETSWFPYQLLGSNNSPVVLGPVHSTMDHRTIELGDLLFSSNGRLWKGVSFIFAPLARTGSTAAIQRSAPSAYGYLNDDLTWASYQGVDTDDLWYLSQVSYIPVEGGSYVLVGHQRLRIYSDYSMAVTQYFDWYDNAFSRISVKWAGDSVNTDVTTSSLSSLEWLKAVASSVFDDSIIVGGGGMMDVFTMVGSGFSAVASLLNVQVLPFLTLGTLLLAPLVVILALAIIKVLNK